MYFKNKGKSLLLSVLVCSCGFLLLGFNPKPSASKKAAAPKVPIKRSTPTKKTTPAKARPVVPSTTKTKKQPKARPKTPPKTRPTKKATILEADTFRLFVKGSAILKVRYTWKSDGSYQGVRTIQMAGQSMRTTFSITPDTRGQWKTLVAKSPRGTMTVSRKGQKALIRFRGKTLTVKLRAGAVLFDNLSPALLQKAIQKYQSKKGGLKVFPMFFSTGGLRDVKMKQLKSAQRTIAGKKSTFQRYILELPGVSIYIWADLQGKIYCVRVPMQRADWVRKGYGALTRPEVKAKKTPKLYKIQITQNAKVPMRDGIKLATDIYRPKKAGKYPVILVRTPYKKEMNELNAKFYARRGYVFVVQDCRGRFSSPGTWEPFMHEAKDGYDAIEWLAKQPWSNGKVGMIGGSYLGWVQWWAASQHPPHLVTIIPNVSPPDPFYNIPYEYGVFFIFGAIWWADILETKATGSLSGVAFDKISRKRYSKLLRSLPVIELDKKVLGKKNPYWRKWIENNSNNRYWQRANFLDKLKKVKIPVFHQSGWFDGDGIGSKLNYLKMKSHGHQNQKLTLGPWGHTAEAHRRARGRDFGPRAIVDMPNQYLRWFDRWLKGIKNGIDKEPLVQIFVMGTNVWLKGNTYPLEGTKMQKWFLHSGGSANTIKGNGTLSLKKSRQGADFDRYIYDPGDPTPAPHYYEAPKRKKGSTWSMAKLKQLRKKHYRKVLKKRKDILVFTSAPMKERYTFAGPISAVIYASTTAKDTDWFITLSEVNAKGEIFSLVYGKLRARFRKSMAKPELLKPGKIIKYTLDLWQTGITLKKGSRLQVEISSASFPLFSRNLNTGGHNEKETRYIKATQHIYHNQHYPSHVLLPMIPESKLKAAVKAAKK